MIRDLDATIGAMLKAGAAIGSALASATISFDLPDTAWRAALTALTVNCYLYDVRENLDMRTYEAIMSRSADGRQATRGAPPIRIDCSYCITAWSIATSDAVLDEHDLLSQVLVVLLRNQSINPAVLQGTLVGQIPPYPTVIASQDGIVKHHPQFWTALDQKLKPSLNYVITLAMPIETSAPAATPFGSVTVTAGQQTPVASPAAPAPGGTATFTLAEK